MATPVTIAASDTPPDIHSHFARLAANAIAKSKTLAGLDRGVSGWAERLAASVQVNHV